MSHQAIRCTPRPGPSRRMMSRWSGGASVLVLAAEAEVVLATAEVAEPRQVVNEQKQFWAVARVWLLAQGDLPGNGGEERGRVSPAAKLDLVGQAQGDPAQDPRLRIIFGSAVEHEEPGSGTRAAVGRGGELGGKADEWPRRRRQAPPRSFWPTISRWLPPWRRKRAEVGSLIATGSPSQAWAERGDSGQRRQVELLAEQRVARQVGGGVSLEDDGRPSPAFPCLPRPGRGSA